MATTNDTGRGPDLLSARSVLSSTQASYPPAAPQIGAPADCRHPYCRGAVVVDELCQGHLETVVIDSIEWLSREEAVVEWRFAYSGFVTTSIVDVEFEAADRSVGINDSYWHASGDCHANVEDLVGEAASLRAADAEDDCREDDGWRDERDDDAADRMGDRGQW